jgi:hypothetical protein
VIARIRHQASPPRPSERFQISKGTFRGLAPLGATVTAQACTDVICLPPADLPVPEN